VCSAGERKFPLTPHTTEGSSKDSMENDIHNEPQLSRGLSEPSITRELSSGAR